MKLSALIVGTVVLLCGLAALVLLSLRGPIYKNIELGRLAGGFGQFEVDKTDGFFAGFIFVVNSSTNATKSTGSITITLLGTDDEDSFVIRRG